MPREIKFNKGRRKFLIAGGIGSAALVLGVYFKTGGELLKSPVELWRNIPSGFHPNAWLSIDDKWMFKSPLPRRCIKIQPLIPR